jgi:hypothetical protein
MNLGKKAVTQKGNGFFNLLEKTGRVVQTPLDKGFRI